jgi:hypothetical protein
VNRKHQRRLIREGGREQRWAHSAARAGSGAPRAHHFPKQRTGFGSSLDSPRLSYAVRFASLNYRPLRCGFPRIAKRGNPLRNGPLVTGMAEQTWRIDQKRKSGF